VPFLRWAGSWRERRAVLVLLGFALLSLVGTIVLGRDPGFLIGISLVAGSVIAAIGVQRGAVHRLIPLPALSYLVTITVAGLVHDWGDLNNSKQEITSFLTWIGGAFLGLVAATVLVVLIAFIRWLASKLLVSGQPPGAPSGPGRTASAPPGREPRIGRAPRIPRDYPPGGSAFGDRDDRDPRESRDPRPDTGSRDGRDRDGRDPWGGKGRRDDSWAPRPPGDPGYPRGQRAERAPRDAQGRRRPGDYRDPRATGNIPRDLW
jgi:hypothetical protein